MLDVIIVGGGPAGLSAALILGRARRRVLLCDSGEPRNAVSHSLHGFLTRDGVDPAELRRIGRAELAQYDTVALRTGWVVDAERRDRTFEAAFEDSSRAKSRALHADLAARLGCTLSTRGPVRQGTMQGTNVPGLDVAGDLAHDVQLAIVAASDGARAACAINTALLREDLC